MPAAAAVVRARLRLQRAGVWLPTPMLRTSPADLERREVRRIEGLGYGSIWSGERIGGKEAFAHHAILLAATRRLVVGTGIANLWARHPAAMQGGATTLAEAYPGRFVLGIGVSHAPLVERTGQAYRRPLERMRQYLGQMDEEAQRGDTSAAGPFVRVLAALRPRMLELARDRADGAHPFLVPVEHTSLARAVLGPDKLLITHQAVLLDTEPARARAIVRADLGPALALPSYAANLEQLGYSDQDLAGHGSDRLVDALVAWGDEAAITGRVRDHLAAGADHVLIQPLAADLPGVVDQLEHLAPAVLNCSGLPSRGLAPAPATWPAALAAVPASAGFQQPPLSSTPLLRPAGSSCS